jgi:ubiquinone/menaquinone biosynthesis C-methylase UbiE
VKKFNYYDAIAQFYDRTRWLTDSVAEKITNHMLHCVSHGRHFLDECDRVLKSGGFYLNCQWITPPARREFEGYFRTIISKYEDFKPITTAIQETDVKSYFHRKGYTSNYLVAKASYDYVN